jgi:hypothetical protein
MKRRYNPHEIKPVLQALAQTKGVIIGGQAVNLWAERYQKDASPWKELRPYTSFDLDVLGNRTDVLTGSQALNAEPFFPSPSENTVNSGRIVAQVQGADFEIDFLHSPNGLSPAEVMELARPITFEQIPLKVLHPLHCVESKTVNLMTLPQDAGQRQDLKHLRLSIAILRQHLTNLTLKGGAEQVLLRWAHRLRSNSNHELGIQAAMKHGIDFRDAVPAGLWRSRPGSLAEFVSNEWSEWEKEITGKVADLRELESWLKSLKENPKGPDLV